MYPNPGYFQSTQPMMAQPMQAMQQPNMMNGYAQQQMTYDPAFVQNLIAAVQTSLAQKGVDPNIANALLANIDPNNPAPPVQTSVARLYAFATQYLQQKGKLVQGQPIRNEDLLEAVWRWTDESVNKIVANMQQQQMYQMRQNFGPGNGMRNAPFPGMFPAGQQPVMMGQGQQFGGGYAAVPPGFSPQQAQQPMYGTGQMQSPYQQQALGAEDNSPSALYGRKPAAGNPTHPPAFGTGLVNKPETKTKSVTDFVYGDRPAPTTTPFKPVDFTKTGPVQPQPQPTAPVGEPSGQMQFIFKEFPGDLVIDDMRAVGLDLVNESLFVCDNDGIDGTVSSIQLKTSQADDVQAFKALAERIPESLIDKGEFFHTVEYKRVRALPIATTAFVTIRDHLITATKQNWDTLVDILDNKTTHGVAVEVDKFLTELINQKLEARFRVEASLDEVISIDTIFDVNDLREGKFGGKLKEYPQWHSVVAEILNVVVEKIFINADYVHPSEKDLADVVKCDDVVITVGNLDKYSLGFVEGETAEVLRTEVFANYTVLRLNHFFAVTNTLNEEDLATKDITPGHDTVGERMFWTMFDTAHKIGKRLPNAVFFTKDNFLSMENVIDYRHSFGTMERHKLHYVLPKNPNTVR